MTIFKCIYRRQKDPTEYELNVLGTSPEEILRYLGNLYGELPYFRVYGRIELHLVMPDVEKNIFNKVSKDEK